MADIFDLFKKIETTKMSDGAPEYIVVGLGNPGAKYEHTRHNAGFNAVDSIASKCGVDIKTLKFKALTTIATIGSHRVLLMKPQTFMNLSGEAVGEAASYYDIPAQRIIVLSDDICMEPGKVRIRRSGSAGGHNGLANIILHLAGDEFPRIKLGVGKKPSPEYDLAAWVLGKMPESDTEALASRFEDVYDAVALIIDGKIDDAMGSFNGK